MSRQIRVIAGKYRGRRLSFPLNDVTRVTKDRAKEALFSALNRYIKGRNVLDLFAGSGSLGIEALSRGATEAVFNELNGQTYKHLEKNSQMLTEPFSLYRRDYRELLLTLPKNTFSLVFLDPPYNFMIGEVLEQLFSAEVLTKDAIIVCETDAPVNFATIKSEIRHYTYGNTFITIIWRNK